MVKSVEEYLLDGCMRCKYGATDKCKVRKWQTELDLMRQIILASGLTETVKWGVPCYTHEGKNILILAAFKEYISISFFNGSWMSDPYKILERQGENTQQTRSLKIRELDQIETLSEQIEAYLQEAIQISKNPPKAPLEQVELAYPEELTAVFAEDKEYEDSFNKLSKGRRKDYLLHFLEAKQSQTRYNRIEKWRDKILLLKGRNDN